VPRRKMRASIAVWTTVLSLLGAGAVAQEPLRVAVNLSTVAFSARDSHGTLVDNLTKEDLEVFEDAVPQKISHFAKSTDVPLTLGLVVDASNSQDHFTKQHQHDLEVFLQDVLGPRDRVFLLAFGNHLRLVSDFTNSSEQILANMKIYKKKTEAFPEIAPEKQERDLGTAFYDSIFYSVTEKLAKENGRRALLLFSDGEDNSSSHDMMTSIETAQAANVVIYSIRYTEQHHGNLTPRNQYGIRVMDRIAKETGGAHIDASTTDPRTYFRQIAEELRTSYELAYYSTNPLEDASFHKIKILPKNSSVTIRSKTGYFSR